MGSPDPNNLGQSNWKLRPEGEIRHSFEGETETWVVGGGNSEGKGSEVGSAEVTCLECLGPLG